MEEIKNKIVVKFSYNCSVVLPIKEGIEIIELLSKAETYDDSDYGKPIIKDYDLDVSLTVLSDKQYKKLKSDAFLREDKE